MNRPTRFAVCGAGFIGKNLVQRLLVDGYSVNVLDHKAAPGDLSESTNWIKGDFRAAADVRRTLEGAEVAYHLVSTTVPGDDHVSLLQELADNISATTQFLSICGEMGVRRIVFVSSASVYGLQTAMPIPETAETNPISSHGIHKLTLEKYLLLHRFHQGTDVRILRLSNPYGPGQSLVGRQGFVAIAIGKMLAGEPLPVRGASSTIRDFIYIADVCDALVSAAVADAPPPVVNIGTGTGQTLAEVLAELGEHVGRPVATVGAPLRRTDIPESVLDIGLARRTFGFRPRVSMSEGLELTLRSLPAGVW
jgi:UDP-glucose 4-epimerase